jgi:hypothetical protein
MTFRPGPNGLERYCLGCQTFHVWADMRLNGVKTYFGETQEYRTCSAGFTYARVVDVEMEAACL